jgi:hypothetical protein
MFAVENSLQTFDDGFPRLLKDPQPSAGVFSMGNGDMSLLKKISSRK